MPINVKILNPNKKEILCQSLSVYVSLYKCEFEFSSLGPGPWAGRLDA